MSPLPWLEPGTVATLGATLLHFVWQGTAAAAVLAAANALLRRRSPQARYAAALATLLAMLALPAGTFAVLDSAPAVGEGEAAPDTVLVVAQPDAAAPEPEGERASRPFPMDALVVCWAAGVLLLSLRTVGGVLLVARLRRSARPLASCLETARDLARRMRVWRPVRVCESLLVQVPTAIGWLQPVILLPPATLMGLRPEQLEMVLAHELAHVRRLDHLVAQVQAVAETLLFYHPLVWWVSHRLRVEREECCDDAAVAACGNALAYARALAALDALRPRVPRTALALSGGSLGRRVRRLLGQGAAEPAPRWPVALFAALLAALAVAAPATLRAARAAAGRPGPGEAPMGAAARVEGDAEGQALAAAGVSRSFVEQMGELGYEPPPRASVVAVRTGGAGAVGSDGVNGGIAGGVADGIEGGIAGGVAGGVADGVEGGGEDGVEGGIEGGVREPSGFVYRLSRRQLIDLRQAGVTPEYVSGLAEAGLAGLSPSALVRLRQQGVTPEYAAGLRDAGLQSPSALELVLLRSQGVQPEDAAALESLGALPVTATRLAALRNQGVTADYIQELQDLGYGKLSVPMLIALRNSGVTPEYVRDLSDAGYRALPAPVLIALRSHGVTPDWIQEAQEAGYRGMSPDQLIALRSQGRPRHE